MSLFQGKFFYRNILVALLSFIYIEIGLPESITSKSVLAQNVSADPFCYWQTTNGASIDLGALCGSKSSLNLSAVSLTNKQNLAIETIKLIIKQTDDDREYYIAGVVRNTGNIAQKYIEVFYQGYELTDGSLKPSESNKVFVDNVILQPGETTTFIKKLKRDPELLILNSLDSVEEGSIPLNICYGSSVEKRELCQRLSPRAINSMDTIFK
jgi:hypothetical protein